MPKTARRKKRESRGPIEPPEGTPVQRWVWLECYCCVAELRFHTKESAEATLAAARASGEEFPTVVDDRGKIVEEVAIRCKPMTSQPKDSDIESYC